MTEPSHPSQGPPTPPLPGAPASQPPPPTTPPLSAPTGPAAPPDPGDGADLVAATWGPARAFAGLGFLVCTAIVAGIVVVGFDNDLESLTAQVTLQGLLAASLILSAFLFASPSLRSLASPEALGLRRPRRRFFWLAVGTYFGYVGCALVIALLLSPEQEDVTRELGADSGVLGTVIAGFLIVIVAPVSEEIFFRGLLFAGFRRAWPLAVAAVFASVIWGVFHYTGPGTWGVVVQISFFGLWLSWLYSRTGSIYPTIAVHAVNNAIAFALLIGS